MSSTYSPQAAIASAKAVYTDCICVIPPNIATASCTVGTSDMSMECLPRTSRNLHRNGLACR